MNCRKQDKGLKEQSSQRSRSRQMKGRREHQTSKKDLKRKRQHSYLSSSSSSSRSSEEQYSYKSETSPPQKRRQTPHIHLSAGQIIREKYKIMGELGTGTFGKVFLAKKEDQSFAVKIIKPVQLYINSAKRQTSIVKILNKADPQEKYHIVKYFQSFYHRQYFCMVFERLGAPLSSILNQKQSNGLPIEQIQMIAYQIFEAVGFMHSQGYTHTDLKPENILFCQNQQQNKRIKLIDMGGATHKQEKHSQIITTRYYRAPQVILECCQWSQSSDIWSIGCILYEMFTRDRLFPAQNDFQHLLMVTENAQENLPSWMSKNCQNELSSIFIGSMIDQNNRNYLIDWEKIVSFKQMTQATFDHPLLGDLIAKCLQMDPRSRITCQDALKHRFFDIKSN